MAWDKTRCEEGILAPDLNNAIRANYEALEAALGKEMNFSTGGTASLQGILKQGSARCYWQATAPATRIDSSAFASTDNGSLWGDSDNNKVYILTDYSTATWTSLESVTIATLLAASRVFAEVITFSKSPIFTLGIVGNNSNLQARNAAGNGNVDMIKVDGSNVVTLPDGIIATTQSADDNSTKLATTEYVDAQVAAGADPTYSGGESHTLDGGLIMKMGELSNKATGSNHPVAFGTDFPGGIVSVQVTVKDPSANGITYITVIKSVSKSGFQIYDHHSGFTVDYMWTAIGY